MLLLYAQRVVGEMTRAPSKMMWRFLIAAMMASSLSRAADIPVAQVPPHAPGTVCYTPQFWCWLPRQQYPGTLCYCVNAYGTVPGTAG